MKRPIYSAVGVDVGTHEARMVVLKRSKKNFVLSASARCDIPDGVIVQGQLKDEDALVKILSRLKIQCKVPPCSPVGLSVHGLSQVMQIVKLPKQLPGNVSTFINQEIKQCVTFAGRDVLTDYCATGGTRQSSQQVLGVGVEESNVRRFVMVCDQAGLSVDRVGPSYLAHVNAFYERAIAPCVKRNLLMLVIRESVMEMGVFRGGVLDFMRNRELTDTGQGGASQAATMLKDVNALMQYYDIEINPDGCQWDLLLSMDASSDVRLAVEEEFRAALPQVQIQRIDEQNANALVPVDIHPKVDGTQTSWTALGLALQAMATAGQPLLVNLVPQDIVQVKRIKRQGLVTATAAAVILGIMGAGSFGLTLHADHLRQGLEAESGVKDANGIASMVDEQLDLEAKIALFKQANDRLQQIKGDQAQIPWAQVLDNIRQCMPNHLWFERLESEQDLSVLVIYGGSDTWQAVKLFENALNKSPYIKEATTARKEMIFERNRNYYEYRIRCKIKMEDGDES